MIHSLVLAPLGFLLISSFSTVPPSAVLTHDPFVLTGAYVDGGPYFAMPPTAPQAKGQLRCFGNWRLGPDQIGTLQSPAFTLADDEMLAMYVAGYPDRPGNFLGLERTSDGKTITLQTRLEPHEEWRLFNWNIPKDWRNTPVRVVSSVKVNGFQDWIALSEPFRSRPTLAQSIMPLARLAAGFLGNGLILLVLGLAPALLLRRLGYPMIPAALCGAGVLCYLVFWLYLANTRLGRFCSLCLIVASAAFVVWTFARKHVTFRWRLSLPVIVWLLATLLYLLLGLAYGPIDEPTHVAQIRYFQWAGDHELPFNYAATILHIPSFPVGPEWNPYERPPLQTCFVLVCWRLLSGVLNYQIASVFLQTSVLLAIWQILERLPFSAWTKRISLAICAFSMFTLMNSFYVWPKLLATTYCLIAADALFFEKRPGLYRFSIAGIALGLGALSHGGSFFAGVAIVFTAVVFFRQFKAVPRPMQALACLLGTAILLLAPWTIYAGRSGRPTDKLIKWHLAGVIENNQRFGSLPQLLYRAYTSLPFGVILQNKWENLQIQFQMSPSIQVILSKPANEGKKLADDVIESKSIYVCFFPLAALLSVGVLAAVDKGRRRKLLYSFSHLSVLLALGLSGTVLWCLLMFGSHMYKGDMYGSNAAAVLEQGSYFPIMCLLFALAALVAEGSRVLAALMLALQVLLFAYLAGAPPFLNLPEGLLDYWTLAGTMKLAAFLCGAALLAILFRDAAAASRTALE